MKILYIITTLKQHGGLERILTDKMNYLAEQGIKVTLVCIAQNKEEQNAYPLSDKVSQIKCGLKLHIDFHNPLTYFSWIKWKIRSISVVIRISHRIKPDIAIATPYLYPLNFPFSKAKTIIEFHCYFPDLNENWINTCWTKFSTQCIKHFSDVIVTLTKADAAVWKSKSRVEVIPNFTNIRPTSPCNYKSKRIIACGRLHEQKGFDLLIAAWRKINGKHPDWFLDIYGNGGLKMRLQQQICEYGLQSSITLFNAVDNIADKYAEHSIFVLSSRYEGFGLVLLEAMACGVSSISFDCPYGPSDIIDNRVNGILVKYQDLSDEERIEKLADSICYLIEHEDERIRLGKAGIERAQLFDKKIIMKKWDELFQSLMQRTM